MFGGMLAYIAHMMLGEGNTARDPPAWDPDRAHQYTFRDWASDVLAWSIADPRDNRRKAAALRLRLLGPARRWARSLPPKALINGGAVGGRQLNPMAFLMHSIAVNWGELGEETAMAAVAELDGFGRIQGETIDNLLIRFELIRERAAADGQTEIGIRHAAMKLLAAVGPNDEQLERLLDPTDGLYPNTEQEYTRMRTRLRRMGHNIEGHPNAIARRLRAGRGQTHAPVYHMGDANVLPKMVPVMHNIGGIRGKSRCTATVAATVPIGAGTT